jgi:predicted acetyltransferase
MNDFKINGGFSYIILNEKGEPCGYLFYLINGDVLTIDEAVYISKEGLDGILWFIYSHNSQSKQAKLRMPSNDPIRLMLYSNDIKIIHQPTIMAQMVDRYMALDILSRAYGKAVHGLNLSDEVLTYLFCGATNMQELNLMGVSENFEGNIKFKSESFINLLG